MRWLSATVTATRRETPRATTLVLDVAGWPGHVAGQHVDVRLTAEDGYQAQRAYSVASPPGDEPLELCVERLDDGEVSPYLASEAREGDVLELRGPIGGYFTWRPEDGGPLLLVAGGSGVVPLRAMLADRARRGAGVEATLLLSARAEDDVLFRAELDGAVVTYTREQPPGWTGYSRRVDAAMLAEVAPPAGVAPRAFVCGPTGFVETTAAALVELGHDPARVKTERFGPTGG